MAKYKILTIDTEDERLFSEALANWLSNGAEIISSGKTSPSGTYEQYVYPMWYAIAKLPAEIKTKELTGDINANGYRERYIGVAED